MWLEVHSQEGYVRGKEDSFSFDPFSFLTTERIDPDGVRDPTKKSTDQERIANGSIKRGDPNACSGRESVDQE